MHLMFRDRNFWRSLQNNEITYGWSDFNLGKFGSDPEYQIEVKKALSKWGSLSHVHLINLFCKASAGDTVIMPYPGNIAIGIISAGPFYDLSPEREETDSCNYFKVDWKIKALPRTELSSNFQTSLKYRKTFLDIHYYAEEINTILETAKDGHYSYFSEIKTKEAVEKLSLTEKLSTHLSDRSKLHFSDNEFEEFVLYLLELSYGLTGIINSKFAEASDGRDLVLSMDYEDIGVNIDFNVQVKQHDQITNREAIDQICKSQQMPDSKNLVATNAHFTPEDILYAREKQVILFDGSRMARAIVDNIDQIDEQYLAKLGIIKTLKFL